MAQAAAIASLAERLLDSFPGVYIQPAASFVKSRKSRCLRALKSHHHLTINHFAIFETLDGLVEKFEVSGHEALASNLAERTRQLRNFDLKLVSDVLSVVIALSDRPIEAARARLHYSPQTSPQSEATNCNEIWRADGWKEATEDINYDESSDGHSSVGDGHTSSELSFHSAPSLLSGSSSIVDKANLCTVYADPQLVESFESKNDSCGGPASWVTDATSEVQLTRQALAMLQGLPTPHFTLTLSDCQVRASGRCPMKGVDAKACESILQSLARIGKTLQSLRAFVSHTHANCTTQAFASCTQHAIMHFEDKVVTLDRTLVNPGTGAHLSILTILHELDKAHTLPSIFVRVIDETCLDPSTSSVIILNSLYEKVCTIREQVDRHIYDGVKAAFLDCLHGYMKTVHRWTLHGRLDLQENDFFITRLGYPQVGSEDLRSKYILCSESAAIAPPTCLGPFALRLFNIGKDVALLNATKPHGDWGLDRPQYPDVDVWTKVLKREPEGVLPFSAVLHSMLTEWVSSQESVMPRQVCDYLLHECNGWQVYRAMAALYLGGHTDLFNDVQAYVFTALSSRHDSAHVDCTALTENIRTALAGFEGSQVTAVDVVWQSLDDVKVSSVLRLVPFIVIKFEYPKILCNILRPNRLAVYRGVSTFLLQHSHASRALTRTLPRFFVRGSHSAGAKDGSSVEGSRGLGIMYSLRLKFIWFFNVLEDHVTRYVLASLRRELEERWRTAENVAAVYDAHEDFVYALTRELFQGANDLSIRRILLAIQELALSFHDLACSQERPLLEMSRGSHKRTFSEKERPSSSNSPALPAARELSLLSDNFNKLLRLFTGALQEKVRNEPFTRVPQLISRLL